MSTFSWYGFLSQPWQGPLLVVVAILLVLAVADYLDNT